MQQIIEIAHSGEFYSAFCALLWATAIVFFRKSGRHIPPVALNFFKNIVGLGLFAITLLVLAKPFIPENTAWQDFVILLLSGGIGIGIADNAFFASLNRLGAGRSAIIDCLYSPFIAIAAFFYLGEPIGPKLVLSILLLVLAILIGTFDAPPDGLSITPKDLFWGIIYGVLSMALMAIGIVIAKPVLNKTDVLWATSVRLVGGIAVLLFFAISVRHRRAILASFKPNPSWKYSIPSAVIGVYFAMTFWIAGMKYTNTSTASVLNQLSTVFMIVLAALFLKEPITLRKSIAVVLGISGALLAVL